MRLPAEWEKHEATWLALPSARNPDNWYEKSATIRWSFAEIARALSRREKVRFTVNSPAEQERATAWLRDADAVMANVEFFPFPTFWGWLRDCAPQFVRRDGRLAAVDFQFNGWAYLDDWQDDNALPQRLAEKFSLPRTVARWRGAPWVLEGGAIDGNGEKVLLTTAECLLDQQTQVRNRGASAADNEQVLREYLGAEQVVWLGRGLAGDDTHGHVDDVCRFVAPRVVVAVNERDVADVNYAALSENQERLAAARFADGGKLTVITLPAPRPVIYQGRRLPASYANFYIGNGVVLVPTFNDVADGEALGVLREIFPDREVIGIYARDLVLGGGSIHCLTMQQPAGDN
ncbi:agmatine deiminase [Planctomycetales bacterium]|nr:agmatine deiminase [Planctomycetales bacterium]GHT05326.1 agmatine deiminase [Planctomycetales bacterium]